MKRILFFVVSIMTSLASYAQKIEITGQVKDDISKNPMEFVYVFTLNSKDSMIVSGVTDENGYFKIPLDPGQYKCVFSQFGYLSDTTELMNLTESKFLDVFKLLPNENMIEEVKVTGETYKLELDKEVKILTSEMKKGSSNTYDLLDKVGGVNYDRYNNKITVDNDDNIIIIVNGLEKDAEYIKNLDPERLQKVEIIRDPSGKYALEGYSAVVNVVLKSNYKGSDLLISTFNITMPFLDTKFALIPFGYNNVSLNMTQRKLNFYVGYSNHYADFKIINTKTQNYSDTMLIEYLMPEGAAYSMVMKQQSHNIRAGLDYYLSPKHTISYEASGSISPDNGNKMTNDFDVVTSLNGVEVANFQTSSLSSTMSKTFNNSLFYIGNYNDKNSMNASYTFSIFQNETDTYLKQGAFETTQYGEDEKTYSTFKAEFNHTFTKKISMNVGYGNTFKILDNVFYNNFGTSTELEQKFGYQELRNQFYTYFSYKPIDRVGIKLGLATENTVISYDNEKKPYWIYQPHVDLGYSIPNIFDIKFKYRSNSRYPTINQTNPFETVVDWQTISRGNPDLSPAVVHRISTKLNVLGGLLSLEPYYDFSNNAIVQVLNIQENGTWLLTYDNAAKESDLGLKAGLTIPLGLVIFQNNARFFKESIDYNGEEHFIKDWTMNSNLVYINKKTGTIFGPFYQNQLRKAITTQGYQTWGNDFWGIIFQQPLLKEKLNIMIIYALPLEWGADFDQGSYTETDLYVENNYIDLDVIKNMVIFQVSYRFTKGKEVKKMDKEFNLEEENTQKSIF